MNKENSSRARLTKTAMLLAAAICVAIPARAQRWERLGPEGGDVLSMAAGVDGTVYLGTADGHVFASADAGNHWELRGRTGHRRDGVVQTLIADHATPQRLYAAVWYLDPAAGGGVFRSDDGGRTWQADGLAGEAARTVEQDRAKPEELIAGTRTGVFRTENSGKTWERISPAGDPELRNVDSVAVDPHDDNVIYAGTYHLPWKTEDGGKTWKAIPAGMIDDSDVMSLRIDLDIPGTIFASACSGIYRSENGGAQWVKLQGIPFSSRRTQEIAQNPARPQELFAATTEGLWTTHDRGENWQRVTPREWIVNAVAMLPSAGKGRLLIGTEAQGVFASDDDGQTFFAANRGFVHPILSAFAADPLAPGHLLVRIAGSPGQLLETRDGGKNWTTLAGGPPKGKIAELFGGEKGWWAAFETSGAARYDANRARWEPVRFVETTGGRGRAEKGLTRSVRKEPQVIRVREDGKSFYLATSEGLWTGDVRGDTARRLDARALSGKIEDMLPGEKACALAAAKLECLGTRGEAATIREAPAEAGQLLWLEQNGDAGDDPLLIGGSSGVFDVEAGAKSKWKLVQSGLPAVAASRAARSGNKLGIATETGGFYVSSDGGKSWVRVDGPEETGSTVGVAPDGTGGFFLGSRSEGLLHWVP